MIEFVLILPLILILIGGSVDFGMFMFQREQAASCVRTVARKAALRKSDAMTVSETPQCQKASDEGGFDLDPPGFDYMNADGGENVTVKVNYAYEPFFLSLDLPGLDPIEFMQVTAEVTMQMEGKKAP
jgi:hypothetical protein